jgi:hypothetical protein
MGWRADLANMCSVGLDQPATDQYAERSSQLADLSQMDLGARREGARSAYRNGKSRRDICMAGAVITATGQGTQSASLFVSIGGVQRSVRLWNVSTQPRPCLRKAKVEIFSLSFHHIESLDTYIEH